MAKIMLVEDDNNLREIYEARLLAEGYEIVSAKDGEEALALAVKEKPDLIISDVMMPKISGFDMLDILRSTPETKDTRVIMMTALSQAEDKSRADKLGADRYLVKSQVTLEDVAKVARDVLAGESAPAAPSPSDFSGAMPGAPGPAPAPEPTAVTQPPAAPTADDSQSVIPPTPGVAAIPQDTSAEEGSTELPKVEAASAAVLPAEQTEDPGKQAAELVEVVKEALEGAAQMPDNNTPDTPFSDAPSQHKKIIHPITPLETKPDIHALAKMEEDKEAATQGSTDAPAADTPLQMSPPAPVVTPQPSPSAPFDPASTAPEADQPAITLPPMPPTADPLSSVTPPVSGNDSAPTSDSLATDTLSTTPEAVSQAVADTQIAQPTNAETEAVEVQINQFVSSAPADTAVEAPLQTPDDATTLAAPSADSTVPAFQATTAPSVPEPVAESVQALPDSTEPTEAVQPQPVTESIAQPEISTNATMPEATNSVNESSIAESVPSNAPATSTNEQATAAPQSAPDPNDPNSIAL
jgi:CheY-like chemotaxis protein